METFIVSARKYRPQTFEDVVGQAAITRTLENAIETNHLAQALLFTGPRGVGKTTCARILAKKINQLGGQVDPNEDFAFNIFELDAASNNGVDDIRQLIESVRIPPQTGKYKVYIIDEVHMLSTSAFNAFLKTLEEPPAHVIYILATTEKHKIIPTILSRCQIFDFKRITVSDMREHLKRIAAIEGINAQDEALHIIAQKADGALRDSLSIFDRVVSFCGKNLTVEAVTENLNVLDRDTYFKMTSLILENNIPQLLIDYDQIMSKGFDGQHFLTGLGSHFRDLMVCKDERTIVLLELAQATKDKYLTQSRSTDLSFIQSALEITTSAEFKYRSSRNQRLLVELTLMQLASIVTPVTGEKKKPLTYVLPARTFENAQVLEPATEATKSLPNSSPSNVAQIEQEELKSTPVAQATATQKDEPVVEKTDSDHILEDKSLKQGEPAAIASDTPNEADTSLEEKRRKLLEKGLQRLSSLSIQGMEKKKELLKNQKQENLPKDKLPEKPFTQEELTLVWDKYTNHLSERGKLIMASILNVDQPILKGTDIHLRFPNASMKEDLDKHKGQILEFLKRELQNHLIDFKVKVDKTVTKKYVYTDQDKFKKLVEKNPTVDYLRRTFDLEF